MQCEDIIYHPGRLLLSVGEGAVNYVRTKGIACANRGKPMWKTTAPSVVSPMRNQMLQWHKAQDALCASAPLVWRTPCSICCRLGSSLWVLYPLASGLYRSLLPGRLSYLDILLISFSFQLCKSSFFNLWEFDSPPWSRTGWQEYGGSWNSCAWTVVSFGRFWKFFIII